jgi:single-strand selective monofunctional uracil DNA glycosylase
MAQTGVPFGEIASVRDWLGIEAAVDKPGKEHPKRPIEGFDCTRSEVSGRRLWGLFRERFETPVKFFHDHFVANYCPLVFMDSGGANITPDKLPADEAGLLFALCDRALTDTINLLKPEWVIGIGGFAKKRIDRVSEQFFTDGKSHAGDGVAGFSSARILHPSPANPKANAGWDREVVKTLVELGVWKP